MKHANPYAGLAGSLTPAELEDPSDAVEERGLRDETGSGEPSAARIGAALGAASRKGAALVHDRERTHNVPVGENGLADEPCKADARDRGTRRRWGWRATRARGPNATSGASPAWTPRTCSPT